MANGCNEKCEACSAGLNIGLFFVMGFASDSVIRKIKEVQVQNSESSNASSNASETNCPCNLNANSNFNASRGSQYRLSAKILSNGDLGYESSYTDNGGSSESGSEHTGEGCDCSSQLEQCLSGYGCDDYYDCLNGYDYSSNTVVFVKIKNDCKENACAHIECSESRTCTNNGKPSYCTVPAVWLGPCGVVSCIENQSVDGITESYESSYGPAAYSNNTGGPCNCNQYGQDCRGSMSYSANASTVAKTHSKTKYATPLEWKALMTESAGKRFGIYSTGKKRKAWDSRRNTCVDWYPCESDNPDDCWEGFGGFPDISSPFANETRPQTPYGRIPVDGIKPTLTEDATYSAKWLLKVAINDEDKNFSRKYKNVSGTVYFYIDSESEPGTNPCCTSCGGPDCFTGQIVKQQQFSIGPGSKKFKNTWFASDLGQTDAEELQAYVGQNIRTCISIDAIEFI
jgi:hypothetical protein